MSRKQALKTSGRVSGNLVGVGCAKFEICGHFPTCP